MGISCNSEIMPRGQSRFHELDEVITGFAFGIHNEIGRFFDEKIYQTVLTDSIIFHVSGIKGSLKGYERHLRRLMSHMSVQALQWVNVGRNVITLTTIR